MSDEQGALLVVVLLAAVIYFLPTDIAHMRRHRNRLAIFALNLLLGWTFLGWVMALVWSLTADVEPKPTRKKSWLTIIAETFDEKIPPSPFKK